MKKSKKLEMPSTRNSTRHSKPSGRLWVENDNGDTMMSWARATVLDRIEELGSLNAAAQSMGISYVKAWRLVKLMNATFPKPLVKLTSGGTRGGGARLTDEGKQAASDFWRLVEDFNNWLEAQRYSVPAGDITQTVK